MVKWDCEPGICYWAAVPAIIGAVGTVFSANRANKQNQQQGELKKQQEAIVSKTEPQAQQQLQQSQQALGPALGYYSSMLANPRDATAPEQNRISGMYQGQAANVRGKYPRGGYGLAAAENLRGQERGAQENVIQNARPQAAGSLATLGSNLGSLGYQGYGLGAGILGNVFNQGLAGNAQQYQQGIGSGQGLFGAYQSYLMNRANSSPGAGGGGGNSLPGGPQSQAGSMYPFAGAGGNDWTGGNNGPWSTPNGSGSLYGGATTPNSGHSGWGGIA